MRYEKKSILTQYILTRLVYKEKNIMNMVSLIGS